MNLNSTIREVLEAVKETGRAQVYGFGTFHLRQSTRTKANNPRTGGVMEVRPVKRVKFRATRGVIDELNA